VITIHKMAEFESDNVKIAHDLVSAALEEVEGQCTPQAVWEALQYKLQPSMPFEITQAAYNACYNGVQDIKPSWIPSKTTSEESNIMKMMKKQDFSTYDTLYEWSIGKSTREEFWSESMKAVGIEWETPPTSSFDVSQGVAHASYFPNGTLNISDSCFNKRGDNEPALIYAMESEPRELQTMNFGVLNRLSNQIANAIQTKLGLVPGEAIAICMPMTPESIAVYLGIVKSGCVVISIADSFSAAEIAMRCRLGKAKAIITQDVIYRGAKFLPLFSRVLEANEVMLGDLQATAGPGVPEGGGMQVVVLPGMLHAGPYPKLATMKRSPSGTWDDKDEEGNAVGLHDSVVGLMRPGLDRDWHSFLHRCSDEFASVKRGSMDACNILFSSGTTGEPKAIVWSHSTPIKCAVDGYYHQNVQTGDKVVWPTNIGWMMGPWLVYQLINGATIGIFNGITSTNAFCQYVEEAGMDMVGVIPSLVKAWQASDAVKDCDWSCVKRFSSTGEASDPVNMLWLVSRVPGFAPVIEYCGGTEIGGSFLSSTMVQPNVPSMFSSPVLGSQLMVLDESGVTKDNGQYGRGPASSVSGEVALAPPCIGLSTHLLNRDHFKTYFEGMSSGPQGETLRRHGDEIEIVRSKTHLLPVTPPDAEEVDVGASREVAYMRALGRCDDTMNIGGIKVGSVEIERACNLVEGVKESAAIAVSGPQGGPSKLVIYVVLREATNDLTSLDTSSLRGAMQKSIKTKLNPLFGISDVVVTDLLPRTASNKVMRRLLRDRYSQ
jgi:acetyl-CoA synthetase